MDRNGLKRRQRPATFIAIDADADSSSNSNNGVDPFHTSDDEKDLSFQLPQKRIRTEQHTL